MWQEWRWWHGGAVDCSAPPVHVRAQQYTWLLLARSSAAGIGRGAWWHCDGAYFANPAYYALYHIVNATDSVGARGSVLKEGIGCVCVCWGGGVLKCHKGPCNTEQVAAHRCLLPRQISWCQPAPQGAPHQLPAACRVAHCLRHSARWSLAWSQSSGDAGSVWPLVLAPQSRQSTRSSPPTLSPTSPRCSSARVRQAQGCVTSAPGVLCSRGGRRAPRNIQLGFVTSIRTPCLRFASAAMLHSHHRHNLPPCPPGQASCPSGYGTQAPPGSGKRTTTSGSVCWPSSAARCREHLTTKGWCITTR